MKADAGLLIVAQFIHGRYVDDMVNKLERERERGVQNSIRTSKTILLMTKYIVSPAHCADSKPFANY